MVTAWKKYELTDDIRILKVMTGDIIVHRIKALVDIPEYGVKTGDLGGYIEKEANLSQYGICWVGGVAWVFQDARVTDSALVDGEASVFGRATICGKSRVTGITHVYDNVFVGGNACICDRAKVYGNIKVCDDVLIKNRMKIFGSGNICGNVILSGDERKEYIPVSCNNSGPEYRGITSSANMCNI